MGSVIMSKIIPGNFRQHWFEQALVLTLVFGAVLLFHRFIA